MITFKQYLDESMDSPYKFAVRRDEYISNIGRDELIIDFTEVYGRKGVVEVIFTMNDSVNYDEVDLTDASPMRVFATVIKAITHHQKSNRDVSTYEFTAKKPKLKTLYKRIMKRAKLPRGWEYRAVNDDGTMVFVIGKDLAYLDESYINEAFNSTYKWKWKTSHIAEFWASKTDLVELTINHLIVPEISFTVNGIVMPKYKTYDNINTTKLLSTVMRIIEDFEKKHKRSGYKIDIYDPKLEKVYDRLISKFYSQEWGLEKEKRSRSTRFTILRKYNLNESFDKPYDYKKINEFEYLTLIPNDKNPMKDIRFRIAFDGEDIRNKTTNAPIYEVAFTLNGNYEPKLKSYSGESAPRIFATIIKAWGDFDRSHPNSVYLIRPADKKLSNLYLKMLRKYARKWKTSVVFDSKGIARIRIDT